jgi:hypothetical protein
MMTFLVLLLILAIIFPDAVRGTVQAISGLVGLVVLLVLGVILFEFLLGWIHQSGWLNF